MSNFNSVVDTRTVTDASVELGAGSFIQLKFSTGGKSPVLVVNGDVDYHIKPGSISPRFFGSTVVHRPSTETSIFIERSVYTYTNEVEGAIDLVTSRTNSLTGVIEFLMPDGSTMSIDTPAYTWAGKPAAAAGNLGLVIRVTNLNDTLWKSNGTNWRPVNGRAVIAKSAGSIASPLVSLSGAPGQLVLPAASGVSSGAVIIPASVLLPGMGIEVSAKLRKTGTGGTWSGAVRVGTANASGDSGILSNTGAATTNNDLWMFGEADVVSPTLLATTAFATPNSPTTGAFVDRNTNINTALPMYVGIWVGSLNAADTVALMSYEIALVG